MPGSHKGTSERSLVYGSITQNLLAFAFFPPLTTCSFLDPTNSNKELVEAPLPDIYIFWGPFLEASYNRRLLRHWLLKELRLKTKNYCTTLECLYACL